MCATPPLRVRLATLVIVALLGLSAAACGARNDPEKIDAMVRGYLDAFAHQDAQAFAGYFAARCHATPAEFQQAFAQFINQPVQLSVQQVTVSSLHGDTAVAHATGTITVNGRSVPLSGATGQNQFQVVRENGDWRIANCPSASSPTAGPPSPSPSP
jgi:uncharacterized protein (TIGR02246 family)